MGLLLTADCNAMVLQSIHVYLQRVGEVCRQLISDEERCEIYLNLSPKHVIKEFADKL